MDMNKNYNLLALQGYDETDEGVAEVYETFPQELLHTPDMNLWITWYEYLGNLVANEEVDIEGRDISHILKRSDSLYSLRQTFALMRKLMRPQDWYEIDSSYNDPESSSYDNEWYYDDEKLTSACLFCYEKHTQTKKYEKYE